MKTKLVLYFFFAFSFFRLSSQVPQGINYQALVSDGSGNPVRNTDLQVKINLLTDTINQTIIWEELHSAVHTDSRGIFSIVIGSGVRQASSTVTSFGEISWTVAQLFIRTQVYFQGVWKNLGSDKLWTVPYAMVANNLSGSLPRLSVEGETVSMDEALFEVRNTTGQTVFAVYNEGVRMYVDNGAKSAKGGFAVSGFGTAKIPAQNLFIVNPDSIRAYVDSETGKGTKGGFAVSGFNNTKSSGEEYLRVTRDSTRIYVNESDKAVKGGFAISGFATAKGSQRATPFTTLTTDNYFIGHEAGMANTTGLYNSFFGYKAGSSNTSGDYNVFIGHYSGSSNQNGFANLFVGDSAGYENTSGRFNIALGAWAGQWNKTGNFNVLIGQNAGLKNITGSNNTYLGVQTGVWNTAGSGNTLIGSAAGQNMTAGGNNLFLGSFSGFNVVSGDNNVYLGAYAGRYNLTGSWNVFLGYGAGRDETGSHRLYISDYATPAPLIYGEFDNGRVVILGNGTNNYLDRTFFVNGTAGGLYSWFNDSDRKLKHNIITIPDALDKVLRLRGVNFLWNNPADGMDGLQMGFIGQEAADVIPELVSVKNDHYSMQYAPVTVLLVEAMKDQQKQISAQQKEIEELKALVKSFIISQNR